jgi:hypothetical protein
MPKIGISTDQLEGLKNPPAGIYEFRLDGFKPAWAKEKVGKERSVNLKPQLVVVNHPTLNDAPIMMWGNTAFGVDTFDLCHALGVQYDNEGSDNPQMPGEFQGPDDDPKQWQYIGPLVGQVGKVEIADTTDQHGKPTTGIKKFFCRVPGCTMPPRDSLLFTK